MAIRMAADEIGIGLLVKRRRESNVATGAGGETSGEYVSEDDITRF